MSTWFILLTLLFIVVSVAMTLIILVQRPQGGGLSGAFGGAGGGGTDTAFGGRTGDALTAATVAAFVIYLGLAVALNLVDTRPAMAVEGRSGPAATGVDEGGQETPPGGAGPEAGLPPDDPDAAVVPATSEATTEVLPEAADAGAP
ncbi:MAG TPA: preprotein translocase subunit SecG [Phycisphaerales bacterium]|nr:preprotein translocase subunit SecG [Phycisphaerales bacterium]HMP37627.1 preprotein translocase subunit SecG [Phycisphaerales bacterium]